MQTGADLHAAENAFIRQTVVSVFG
jgi:hypothetical protein